MGDQSMGGNTYPILRKSPGKFNLFLTPFKPSSNLHVVAWMVEGFDRALHIGRKEG